MIEDVWKAINYYKEQTLDFELNEKAKSEIGSFVNCCNCDKVIKRVFLLVQCPTSCTPQIFLNLFSEWMFLFTHYMV